MTGDRENLPDRAVQDLLREAHEAGPQAFEPGFVSRVMGRLRAERSAEEPATGASLRPVWSLEAVLRRQFLRLAPVGLAALLVIGVYNLSAASDAQSPVEAALGLEPLTLAAVYDVGPDLYTTEGQR